MTDGSRNQPTSTSVSFSTKERTCTTSTHVRKEECIKRLSFHIFLTMGGGHCGRHMSMLTNPISLLLSFYSFPVTRLPSCCERLRRQFLRRPLFFTLAILLFGRDQNGPRGSEAPSDRRPQQRREDGDTRTLPCVRGGRCTSQICCSVKIFLFKFKLK